MCGGDALAERHGKGGMNNGNDEVESTGQEKGDMTQGAGQGRDLYLLPPSSGPVASLTSVPWRPAAWAGLVGMATGFLYVM